MARINVVNSPSEVGEADRALAEHIVKVLGGVRGPMSVLMNTPALAAPVMNVGDFFRVQSRVSGKLRILGILIAARERQGVYVWAAQVNAARRAGVPEATIDLIRSRAPLDKYAPDDREVIAFAEQLMKTNRVEQATFDRLNNRYGAEWLIELTGAMSYYAMLSNIVSAFEVAAPADGDKLPS